MLERFTTLFIMRNILEINEEANGNEEQQTSPLLHSHIRLQYILGLKTVGIAACQIARAYGCKVLGTAGTPEGLDLVFQNGAHKVFNHREKDYIDKIQEATGEGGINVILEMVADVNLSSDLQLVSSLGRVIVVGCRGHIEINPADTMAKESSIIGVSLYSETEEERRESAAALFGGMESGWLRPLIGPEYTLKNASQAHVDIIKNSGATGKMVFVI